jgi:hypothetical protein
MRIFFAFLFGAFSLSARAEDAKKEFPEEIFFVSPGTTLVLGSSGVRREVTGKSWLFPERHYLSAIQQAQKLQICEPALLRLRDDYATLLGSAGQESSACLKTLEDSIKREENLLSRVSDLESQNANLKQKVYSARRSSLTAWSITGALVVGAGTAIYITTNRL